VKLKFFEKNIILWFVFVQNLFTITFYCVILFELYSKINCFY